MEVKEKIATLMDTGNHNRMFASYAIEQLVFVMLNDYATSQGKQVTFCNDNNARRSVWGIDFLCKNGIDEYAGPTGISLIISDRISTLRSKSNILIKRLGEFNTELENIIILFIGTYDESRISIPEKVGLQNKISIWDISKLTEICNMNPKLFNDTYDNLFKTIVATKISDGIDREVNTYQINRDKYIKELKQKYNDDNLTLFLGAGASIDAKITNWNDLISELFIRLLNKSMTEKGYKLTGSDISLLKVKVMNQNGQSPLLQTRFLRQGFSDDFEDAVRDILYKESINTSGLLDEIGHLSIPTRGKLGIRAIVNYNFDDLIEKKMEENRIKYKSIFSEGEYVLPCELGIYHVHGFLPEDKTKFDGLSKSLLVFSEEGYHKLLLDPYNWANMIQLELLSKSTCLFIGLSMTDPNLRRLLEISQSKKVENSCDHYVLLKRESFNDLSSRNTGLKKFELINEELQETFYKELGVNVIWVDEFKDVPAIIKQLKTLF